jgi:hypothetical protein
MSVITTKFMMESAEKLMQGLPNPKVFVATDSYDVAYQAMGKWPGKVVVAKGTIGRILNSLAFLLMIGKSFRTALTLCHQLNLLESPAILLKTISTYSECQNICTILTRNWKQAYISIYSIRFFK